MIAIPLWLVPAAPMALLITMIVPSLRGPVRALVPLAPLPALAAALADPIPEAVRLDWLLLGADLAMSGTAAVFMFFTALLWGLAGWQATRLLADDQQRDRFAACFLAAMAGNLGLLLARDIASFYAFFAMMSLASWGLVMHGGGAAQRRAGLVYIAFAISGELALFAGLTMAAHAAGGITLGEIATVGMPPVAAALIAAGLLVKLGAVPLHLWLPLAHAAAPAPASAVLSGAMLKAGLFGLMTLLPPGAEPVPLAATLLAAMAVAGLVLAPVLGLVQGDPKAVLAYSSIGQMSLMALGYAAALAAPALWPAMAIALMLLAVHHGFAKAALFLGVPTVWATAPGGLRALVLAALALPALALAGLPGTSGYAAKSALKSALEGAPEGWLLWTGAALFAGSLGTALLMLRAMTLLAGAAHKLGQPRDAALPWLAMSGLVLIGLWSGPVPGYGPSAPGLADLAPVPLALALGLAAVAALRAARLRLVPPQPGELVALFAPRPETAPILALPGPPQRGRALVPRRAAMRPARPERGGLAVLGMAAVAVLAALVMDAPPPPPPDAQPHAEEPAPEDAS